VIFRPPFAAAGIAVLALCLSLSSCDGAKRDRVAEQPGPAAPRIVLQGGNEFLQLNIASVPGATTAVVSRVELPAKLETTGQIAFDDRRVATIISRVSGRIEDTRVSQWDEVRRGEPIAQLFSPEFMTAEAEYLEAASTLRINHSASLVEQSNLANAMVTSARRKLELLGLSPDDIRALRVPSPNVTMRAPISGTVVEKKAVRGAQITPGDVLFSLGTLDNVWITADLFENDIARVHEGQHLEAEVASYPGETFHGVVGKISPNIDPSTHTLQIRCELANPDRKLKPQMLARISIITTPGAALVVPQDALVFDTNAYYAYVVSGGYIARRKVDVTSWNERGFARVISGLEQGDRVVKDESIQVNALWHQAHGESS